MPVFPVARQCIKNMGPAITEASTQAHILQASQRTAEETQGVSTTDMDTQPPRQNGSLLNGGSRSSSLLTNGVSSGVQNGGNSVVSNGVKRRLSISTTDQASGAVPGLKKPSVGYSPVTLSGPKPGSLFLLTTKNQGLGGQTLNLGSLGSIVQLPDGNKKDGKQDFIVLKPQSHPSSTNSHSLLSQVFNNPHINSTAGGLTSSAGRPTLIATTTRNGDKSAKDSKPRMIPVSHPARSQQSQQSLLTGLSSLSAQLAAKAEPALPSPTTARAAKAKRAEQKCIQLARRLNHLMLRSHRLLAKQGTRQVSQQLADFVEKQRRHFLTLARTQRTPANDDMQTQYPRSMQTMSTSELVQYVHNIQQTQQSQTSRNAAVVVESVGLPTSPSSQSTSATLTIDPAIAREIPAASGRMRYCLQHTEKLVDPDATDSSSGEETEDESLEARQRIPLRLPPNVGDSSRGDAPTPDITYYKERARVASKWTWLQAQVSDLEYRIRQQTELYRKVKSTKGDVVLSEHSYAATPAGVIRDKASAATVPGAGGDASSKTSSSGEDGSKRPRIESEKGDASSDTDAYDHSCVAARCRPLKSFKNRRLYKTTGLHTSSRKAAAKLSSVQCGCYAPDTPCTMCGGRVNNMRRAEASDCMSLCGRVSLLDPSFHPVLSTKKDIPDWVRDEDQLRRYEHRSTQARGRGESGHDDRHSARDALHRKMLKKKRKELRLAGKDGEISRKKLKKLAREKQLSKERRLKNRTNNNTVIREDGSVPEAVQSDVLISSAHRSHEARSRSNSCGANSSKKNKSMKLKIKKKHLKESVGIRSRSLSENVVHVDDDSVSMSSATNDSSQSLSHSMSTSGVREMKRKQSLASSAFDIDNVVIPTNQIAVTKIEVPNYKEIVTPKWRDTVGEADSEAKTQHATAVEDNGRLIIRRSLDDNMCEDLSDEAYLLRHEPFDQAERRRALGIVKKEGSGENARSETSSPTPSRIQPPRRTSNAVWQPEPSFTQPWIPRAFPLSDADHSALQKDITDSLGVGRARSCRSSSTRVTFFTHHSDDNSDTEDIVET